MLLVLAWASNPSAAAEVAFDIPAQALGPALNNLAVQANLQIFFEQEPVAGLKAPAISGTMTPQQALQQLLANTRLVYSQNSDGTFVVKAKPAPAPRVARRKPAPAIAHAPINASLPATPLLPQSVLEREGPWLLRARVLEVDPHHDSGVNEHIGAEIDAEYFFASHWSAELALNLPQRHDVKNGGSVRLMPDFLMMKYGLAPEASIRPYVGLGLNVTSLSSHTTAGAAAQVGADFGLSPHWTFNLDVKWARSRPDVEFAGAGAGRLKLDPVLFGIGFGYRFGASSAPAPLPPPAVAVAPAPAPLPAVVPPPVDSDGDGVPDDLDQCPGTPPGLRVDARGCEIEEMVLTGVTFQTDSTVLTAGSSATLDQVVAVLRLRPNATTEIHGYTDNRGSDVYNQKLSERRAAAVVQYLVSHGIAGPHLSARGFGEADPVADNDSADGRAKNRRVTVQFSKPVPR